MEQQRSTDTWRRPPPTAAQQRHDALIALALVPAALFSLVVTRDAGAFTLPGAPPLGEQVAWVVALVLPLTVRRRHPLATLVVVAGMFIALQVRGVTEATATSLVLYLALFTAGAWGRDRRTTHAVRAVVVVAMFAWLGISLSTTAWGEATRRSSDAGGHGLFPAPTAAVLYSVAFNLVYFAAAWVFGDLAWRAACQHEALVRANRALADSQAENARRAVLAERVRLARELHDVVAHHVSVMGVQAGAARAVLDVDPAAAKQAIRAVEASSRSAVGEMRHLLGLLREEERPTGSQAPDEPAPGLEQLPALVAGIADAGLRTTWDVVGHPRPVPVTVGTSVYRVVQEALTNVVKHARARTVGVRLRYLADAVEVEVVDDGHGGQRSSATPHVADAAGPGFGLVGMAERAALHGGHLDAGPRPHGGFRVRARIPLAVEPAP